jgi:gas vesicle protein
MVSQRIQNMIIRMINKIKQDTNECLTEFQKDPSKLLKEIKSIVQDMKEEFKADREILKKKLKFWE